MVACIPLSCPAKAWHPVITDTAANFRLRRILDHPPSRMMTSRRMMTGTLLLQNELAVGKFPAVQPRQKRHAEEIVAQRAVRQHHGGDVAHRDVFDLDPVELDR